MRPHLQRSTKSIPRFYNQLFHWTFLNRISCINFIISPAILDTSLVDTSYLNMHFFGTHTCLCGLQSCPSADFGVFKYAWSWVVTQKVWNEAENGVWQACAYYSYATLYRLLYWFWEKNRLFCSLTYWIWRRLRPLPIAKLSPSNICSLVFAASIMTTARARAPHSTKKISYSS